VLSSLGLSPLDSKVAEREAQMSGISLGSFTMQVNSLHVATAQRCTRKLLPLLKRCAANMFHGRTLQPAVSRTPLQSGVLLTSQLSMALSALSQAQPSGTRTANPMRE